MVVKITGPTEITSNNPIAIPLSIASITSTIYKAGILFLKKML
jgi:hypothetical protein